MDSLEELLGMMPDRIKEDILAPVSVAIEMVNMLPPEVWNSHTKFLDPTCKSGIFLYEIYKKLMNTESVIKEFPNEKDRKRHIFRNQLYGVALNPTFKLITERTLYGRVMFSSNIITIDNYQYKTLRLSTYDYKNSLNMAFGENIKFDVAIGYPPSKSTDNIGSGGIQRKYRKTIYHKFIEKSIDLANVVCMITKNTWLSNETLEDTRNKMIQTGIISIENYSVPREKINEHDASLCIFLINKGYNRDTRYREFRKGVIVSDYFINLNKMGVIPDCNEAYSLIKKVEGEESFSSNVITNGIFGIGTNGSIGNGNYIDDRDTPSDYYNTPIKYSDTYRYMNDKQIPRNEWLKDYYKATCSLLLRYNSKVLASLSLVDAGEVHTTSFTDLYASKNKEECLNVIKYMKTKFVRTLVKTKVTETALVIAGKFQFVPNQNFSNKSDIDWSLPVSDIDRQLYKKYKLSAEEIRYIESTVKAYE